MPGMGDIVWVDYAPIQRPGFSYPIRIGIVVRKPNPKVCVVKFRTRKKESRLLYNTYMLKKIYAQSIL